MRRTCVAFRRVCPMTHSDGVPPGPVLAQGVPLADVPNGGVLAGHVDGEPVLLARLDDGLHAVAGSCTHYGGSLGEGLVVDGEVRGPLQDRKSVVEGKSVSVRVDLGGRRIIQKNNTKSTRKLYRQEHDTANEP